MKDRIPKDPGRVLISPENGSASFYATVTRADNPEQEGTPLNKNSLLKDETAALFGVGTNAVPDDVLVAINGILNTHAENIAAGTKVATGSYTGTGKYGKSNPSTITVSFVPKIVFIYRETSYSSVDAGLIGLFINPSPAGWILSPANTNYPALNTKSTWSGNSLSWYSTTNEKRQMNESGIIHHYVAIG